MLHKFLITNRKKIIALAVEKTAGIAENRPTSAESELGLPRLYDHLIVEMKRESQGSPKRSAKNFGPNTTRLHGKELSRLGYTVSQVVHGYGVLCQAVTEYAVTTKAAITSAEFSAFNLFLDVAIADAVAGYTEFSNTASADSTKRIGMLVHELRNSMTAAIIAHSMIKDGTVGIGGNTSALLERNLNRMRDILDRSFAEVRLQTDKLLNTQVVLLIDVVGEVEATASVEAGLRRQTISVEVSPRLQVYGDHHYLISALSNVMQNAIKYSRQGGTIRVVSHETKNEIVVEVEDQCGGLPRGKAEELFQPFTQKNSNRSGLGLGLTISRQAIALHGGTLTVRDVPGKGCVFSITLPKRSGSDPSEPLRLKTAGS
jgi:signal transduction histidine kinase